MTSSNISLRPKLNNIQVITKEEKRNQEILKFNKLESEILTLILKKDSNQFIDWWLYWLLITENIWQWI